MTTSIAPIILKETSAPATPPSGHVVLYSVDGSALLMKDDAGAVSSLGGGSTISSLTSATTLAGTEVIPVVQGGTTKKTTVTDIRGSSSGPTVKVVAATRTNSTTTPAAITDFTTSLVAGTYLVSGWIVWQSSATATGAGFFINCSGGTVTRCVGHVYATTTGTTATTGVADQATVAGTFQTVEARAWRANNTNPGTFGGVDTANSDMFAMLEAVVTVTVTTSMDIMFVAETAAAVSVMADSTLSISKVA